MELGCFSANFATANTDLFSGRARFRRVFDPYLPAVGDETWRTTPAGVRPFWSLKAPDTGTGSRDWAGAIAGDHDALYAAVFAEVPADMRLTVAHEPENDLSAADFRALTERMVDIFRATAPEGAEYWIVADHWQWDPGHSSATYYQSASEAADVRALCSIVDGAACDVYASSGRGMVSVADEPGFIRWLGEVGSHAPAIGITERGITAETATTRKGLLIQDAADCEQLGMKFYSYWHGGGPAGADEVNDQAGRDVLRMWAAAKSG